MSASALEVVLIGLGSGMLSAMTTAAVMGIATRLYARHAAAEPAAPVVAGPQAPPQAPAAPQTPQERMEALMTQAPGLFQHARDFEQRRLAIACVVCGEPTAIQCEQCMSRVCVVHKSHAAHVCSS